MARFANEDDLKGILNLYSFLHENDKKPDPERLKDNWNQFLEHDCFQILIAEADDKIVSCLSFYILPNLTRGARSFAVIENVVTHIEYRRSGYAKEVLKEAISFARKMDCHKVILLSNKKRKKAHQLYRKLGFSSFQSLGFVKKL